MTLNNNHNNNNSRKDQQEQFVLQAVVLADAAELRFRPMTIEKPRVSAPNSWVRSREFLATAGVQEIFVFCNAHADQVRQYLAGSKWSNRNIQSPLKIHTIYAPETYSVGDVMRELDGKGLIQNDFILVSGNVISNMKFDSVLQEHRRRRESNKDTLMTMVMKQASPNHRSRAKGEGAIVAVDPTSSECLHYESLPVIPQKRKVLFDTLHFKKHPVLQVHNDLLDCQIDICSPEVPALFTENFDYQSIRKDFVRGILTSDLYGKIIYLHILGDEYAARVKSTQLYDSIARDIIQRWTFPMVPDSNIHIGHTYRYHRNNIYKELDVSLAISCIVDRNVVIGSGTDIGENSHVSNCTIGRNCKIGRNVVLDGAYIWENVTIDDNCTVRHCIVADGVHVKNNVNVTRGCLLSFNVVVGPNISLLPFTKLTACPPPEDIISTVNASEFIGTEGVGYMWNMSWEEDEDEEEKNENLHVYQIGSSSSDLLKLEAEFVEFVFSDSELDESEFEDGDETKKHHTEIEETVRRAVIENHTVDNASLEVNALKMACNIHFRDLPPIVIPVILMHIDFKDFVSSARKILGKWCAMIKKFALSENDKMDCLMITMDYCKNSSEDGIRLFRVCLEAYWNFDVIDDEDIFRQWCKTSAWTVETSGFKKVLLDFIEKLDELETEDEDQEDSE